MSELKESTIEPQVAVMLSLQNEINIKIDPAWSTRCRPWYRAIWIEAGEMMDHIGYKWWKHQSIDIAQVQLEIVDIWHFALSIYCEKGVAAHHISPIFESNLLNTPETARQETILRVCEEFASDVLSRIDFPIARFIALMNVTGMTIDDLYRLYVGKNVLNTFRQDYGYRDGTYIKEWNGEEDNVVLSRLADELDSTDSDYPSLLREALENAYALVLVGQPSL